ncbi:SDR family oxidoreductase [Streptomyces carpaticus]|uniref:3-oxoacyl-[acyl-carrier protein] reductase n=1 Tax=Streptomyces harbinensis TaxID=1176198 RepID=A0A1I6T3A0_9ACTN|nr:MULTISPECIES: SDR family oxidoreductase [Streptomyces]UWM50113.1 SDR family oxidoreductase [Streptomyces carpaticus]SFS83754.1 3-oxoacyl-[acyl-carrier protein] reductase [Streptomyces harbinensis]
MTSAKRTVVISGGGTGIGLATADAFARGGDTPVLIGRRAEVLERAAERIGGGAVAVPADLTDPAQVARAAAEIGERFGTVDVLINNAGGLAGGGEPTGAEPAERLAAVAAEWETAFRLNTLSAVLLTEALRERLASPGGRVLFVSSIAAYRGSGRGSYGSGKAALHPHAFDLARQLGPRGITVNVVAPGLIADTEFFGPDGMPQERLRARVSETMNGRAGEPGDVAQTLHWLASHAAGHITAQTVQVNGGAERGR